MREILEKVLVVAVVVIDDASNAVPLARALVAGGLPVACKDDMVVAGVLRDSVVHCCAL
jgi:hypothetical protein